MSTYQPIDSAGDTPIFVTVPLTGPPKYELRNTIPGDGCCNDRLREQWDLIKRIKDGSANSRDYFMLSYSVTKIVVDYLLSVGCMVATIALPVAMIVIGALYQNSCPAIPSLPILLIAIGSSISVSNLINLFDHFLGKYLLDATIRSVFVVMSNIILNGNVMLLFAFLCVWIFGSPEPDITDSMAQNYCHHLPYLFAYWLTASALCFLWMIFLIACICWCVSATA